MVQTEKRKAFVVEDKMDLEFESINLGDKMEDFLDK